MTKEKIAMKNFSEINIEFGKIKSKLKHAKKEIKFISESHDKLDEFGKH